jgi:hypothetical protein
LPDEKGKPKDHPSGMCFSASMIKKCVRRSVAAIAGHMAFIALPRTPILNRSLGIEDRRINKLGRVMSGGPPSLFGDAL